MLKEHSWRDLDQASARVEVRMVVHTEQQLYHLGDKD